MKWLFCPLPAGKFWDGTTLYTEPLGGSESAVAYVARALARQGEDVSVLGHMDPQKGVGMREIDDVKYYHSNMLPEVMAQEWDVVVSSRWREILEQVSWNTQVKTMWFHDMYYGDWRNFFVNLAVYLTEFQRASWGMTEDNSVLIGNGVDLSLFRGKVERSENKLVWISNPDRGLALAAKIFQEIRKRWPFLELHVYGRASVYGWGPEAEGPFLPRPEHMENVFLHEPAKKSVLARALQEAWAMFYPTYWPETYCIAALEAQAAGCPVIAPPFGALTETVKGGILTYDFLNAVSQLRNKGRWEDLSAAGIEFAARNSWDHRANEWRGLIEAAHVEIGGKT